MFFHFHPLVNSSSTDYGFKPFISFNVVIILIIDVTHKTPRGNTPEESAGAWMRILLEWVSIRLVIWQKLICQGA